MNKPSFFEQRTHSASYIDLFLNIDQEGKLVSKIKGKWNGFNCPIVILPNIYGNILVFLTNGFHVAVDSILLWLFKVSGYPEVSIAVIR